VTKEADTKKSPLHLSSGIKTELEKVYITSSGDKYLKKMDALCAESQIQQAKESKQRRRNKVMDIVDILFKVLEENNWSIFYNNKPIRSLDTQDGGTLYEVNKVDLDEIERVILNKLDESWKPTQPPTPENLTQNQN
jgi:hypothetical protein